MHFLLWFCKRNMEIFSGLCTEGSGLSLPTAVSVGTKWRQTGKYLLESSVVFLCGSEAVPNSLRLNLARLKAFGKLNTSKSLENSHILSSWKCDPYEPITLDPTAAGSQSYYVVLDIEPRAPRLYHDLFWYEYIILTAFIG